MVNIVRRELYATGRDKLALSFTFYGRTQELKQQLTSRLFLIFSSVLQQFLVIRSLQVVFKKSTLHRKIRLLIGIPGPGNAS